MSLNAVLEREKKKYFNQNSRSFLNYDANLTIVTTWRSNSVIHNLFTCNVYFPVWQD